jgi:hypothetical protein
MSIFHERPLFVHIIASILGELIDPPSLNSCEEFEIEHYRTMQEIEELDKWVKDMQQRLEPMLDQFNIPYDWGE